MQVKRFVSENRGASFLIGTAFIQIVFVVTALFLRAGSEDESTKVAALTEAKPQAAEVEIPKASLDFSSLKHEDQNLVDENINTELNVTANEKPSVKTEDSINQKESAKVSKKNSAPQKEAPESESGQNRTLQYKVKSGETLTDIWRNNNAPYAGALAAAKAFEDIGVPLHAVRAGEKIELGFSDDGDIITFEKRLYNGDTLRLAGNSSEGYTAQLIKPEIVEFERTVSRPITNSFAASANDAEVPYTVIDELVDLFSTKIEFSRDLQPGDTFSVTYTERNGVNGESFPPGAIKTASIQNNGKLLVAISYEGEDGKLRYYDRDGNPLGNYFLRYPLKFSRISSAFSHRRFHPILKRFRPHHGVDFAAPVGTPVRSVADGVIISKGYGRGEGNMLKIKHGSRYKSAYLHLSRFAKGIKNGARVTRGQVIGYVGSTGYSTGPHLDYRLYDRGRNVDPLKVELPQMPLDAKPIPAEYLKVQLAKLKRQHEILHLALLGRSLSDISA